jgi:SH3-like domain-containing protein
MRRSLAPLLALFLALPAGPTRAAETKLPIPRFVSLKSDEVNLRTGPGTRYPIEWVVSKKGLPVEVIAEFDTWRRVRDWEGIEGWVQQALLTGRRSLVVTGKDEQPIYNEPNEGSGLMAKAEPGVIGALLRCPVDGGQADWCYVDLKGYRGWMRRASFWGAYPGEKVE